MSYHSHIHGEAQYETINERDAVLKELRDTGWDVTLGNEVGVGIHGVELEDDEAPYCVVVPMSDYVDLGNEYDILTDTAVSWRFIEATSDGALEGYVETTEKHKVYDLHEWVKNANQLLWGEKPNRDEFENSDKYFDADANWELKVMSEFLNKYEHGIELKTTM